MELLLLFILSFVAATVSGTAGFGGALLLLPTLTSIVGIKTAVPILTIGQIFGNASRIWFGRKELKWKPILYFLLPAVPFAVLGSYFFTEIESGKIKSGIGCFLILLVLFRRTNWTKINLGNKGMALGGGLTGFLSGLAGSAGPLGAAFFLGLNLPAVSYIASEAFTALALHLTKSIVYNRFSLIGPRELYYGFFIGAAMVFGSWTGKKIIEKISRAKFILMVEILLLISGIQLILSAVVR